MIQKHAQNMIKTSKTSNIFEQIPQRFTKGSNTNQTRFKKIQKRFKHGPKTSKQFQNRFQQVQNRCKNGSQKNKANQTRFKL